MSSKHERYDEETGFLTITPDTSTTTGAPVHAVEQGGVYLARWCLAPGADRWSIVKAAHADGWFLHSVSPTGNLAPNTEQTLTFTRDESYRAALVDENGVEVAR
jgi:hypothetical protein